MKSWKIFIGVFFLSFIPLLLTLYPTVTTEDSGEFITAIESLGIAHPSGYPLYVILGKFFSILIPFGNPGWKANLFSAFCASLALATLALLLQKLFKNKLITFLFPLFLLSGPIFWAQSIRAEVYGLNSFFLILVILIAYQCYEYLHARNIPKATQQLFLLTGVFSLSLGNHHLMVMAALPIAIWLLINIFSTQSKKILNGKNLTIIFCLFLLGLSVYLYLPIRANQNPDLNWGNPSTWENFWLHVDRKVYEADSVNLLLQPVITRGKTVSGSQNIPVVIIQENIIQLTKNFVITLSNNYTFFLCIFLFAGFFIMVKKQKNISILFILLFLFYGPILSHFIKLGIDKNLPSQKFTELPFYLPIFIISWTIVAFVANEILNKISKTTLQKYASGTIIVIFVILLPYKIITENQSQNYLAYDLAKSTLKSLPPNSVLYSENSDNSVFPYLYLQKVEHFRPDINIYINSPINVFNYFTTLNEVEQKHPGQRIFADFPFVYYPDKTYVYSGAVGEIVDTSTEDQQPSPLNISNESITNLRGKDQKNLDYFHQYLLGRHFMDLALTKPVASIDQTTLFETAIQTAPNSLDIFSQLIGNYLLIHGQSKEAIPYLESAYKFLPNEYHIIFQLTYAYLLEGQENKAQAIIKNADKENQKLLLEELKKLEGRK